MRAALVIVVLSAAVSMLLAVASWVTRPHEFTCPPWSYVEGVRLSGRTSCVQAPPRGCGEPRGRHSQACPEGLRLDVMVWCGPDEEPRVVDGRRVTCRRMRMGT